MAGPSRGEFELRVVPDPDDRYALEVWQRARGEQGGAEPVKLVHLGGDPLRAVVETVLAALGRAGHRGSDLSRSRREPLRLLEEDGVRLALLFLAVRPLRKLERVEAVATAVRGLAPEELSYWFAKSTSAITGRRALKALRHLLAEE